MDFIFMLTRQDQTVEDCLELFEAIKPIGLRHVGFKDVGVTTETLIELNRRIRLSGATSYMEVVSPTVDAAMASARTAVRMGVDYLLGGTDAAAVLDILGDSEIAYCPFPGRPQGHPTRLGGTPDEIAADCSRFVEMGCAGADLLAFRATESEPLELVRAARTGLGQRGQLIVAGNVDSPEAIRAVGDAGADAFTIGSAVLQGAFSPRKGLIHSQLRDVLAACGQARRGTTP